jgi:hypothetical protein
MTNGTNFDNHALAALRTHPGCDRCGGVIKDDVLVRRGQP